MVFTPDPIASPVASEDAALGKSVRHPVSICDTTLRDGSHSMQHRFSQSDVRQIAAGLDASGVSIVEVTHGDGLGGSSFNYGFGLETDIDLIRCARAELKTAKLAALMIPGIGTIRNLGAAIDAGIDIIRIATHCTEADIAIQHLGEAKRRGIETVGFLMMSHMVTPSILARQALIMREAGADTVYVVDSAGALLPGQVSERVEAMRDALDPQARIGMHAHNNLGVGVANALAATESGAVVLDGSLHGLGAGAGNAATEVLCAALDRADIATGVDTLRLIDVAEDVVGAICAGRLPTLDRGSLLLGYVGVYSSFLLHARRAARQYSVSEADILLELGAPPRGGWPGGPDP